MTQIVYFMQAACTSDTVTIFGNALSLEKSTVAMIVVLADIIASIVLFFLFSFLKSMQELGAQEIDDSELTAKDFTVEIRGLPPHDNVREFKAALWQWIE